MGFFIHFMWSDQCNLIAIDGIKISLKTCLATAWFFGYHPSISSICYLEWLFAD